MNDQPLTLLSLPSLEATLDLIRRRRSWKPALMDADRDVPTALIEKLLEAARWAPTHGLTEPWRIRIFTGEARQQLAHGLPTLYDEVTPEAERRPEKREKLGIIPLQVPVILALGYHSDGGKIPGWEELAATAAAVQNMHLTATAAGLAAMWSSPPLCSTVQGQKFLGFEAGTTGLGFFYLGWPRSDAKEPVTPPRRPIADRFTWIR
jgi:nitroreductase